MDTKMPDTIVHTKNTISTPPPSTTEQVHRAKLCKQVQQELKELKELMHEHE